MAINLFLKNLPKDEYKEIIKTIILLLSKKSVVNRRMIFFINRLSKYYNFSDEELDRLYFIDTRYKLKVVDVVQNLSSNSTKMLLFLMVIFDEVFQEVKLDKYYKKEKILKQFPIDEDIQKEIVNLSKEYLEKTIDIYNYIYKDSDTFFDKNKKYYKKFFLLDFKRLRKISKKEKKIFLQILYYLMMDDGEIKYLEEQMLQLWSFYFGVAYKEIKHLSTKLSAIDEFKEQWVKKLLIFSYLITQENKEEAIIKVSKIFSIDKKDLDNIKDFLFDYHQIVSKLYDILWKSKNLTTPDENIAQNMQLTLNTLEFAFMLLPQARMFQYISYLQKINAFRHFIGLPITIKESITQEDEQLIKLQEGDENSMIVCIDGFLSEKTTTQFSDWLEGLNTLEINSKVYGFKWQAKNYNYIPNKGLSTWYEAVSNSLIAGEELSKYIISKKSKNPNLEITLMGHSLGARVIFNTLHHLINSNIKVNRVFLFGGAKGRDIIEWTDVSFAIREGIYNFYSKKDGVLKNLYSVAMLEKPIGLSKIKIIKNKNTKKLELKNINVTNIINGHGEYKPKLDKILNSFNI